MAEHHLTRKELKQDKVHDALEHGAEAVFQHTKLVSWLLIGAAFLIAAYFGWKFYAERQSAEAETQLADAMKIFTAPIRIPGQPALPGEITYSDAMQRAQDAQPKFAAVADKYPGSTPGRMARYYSAITLMDLDKPNQADEELKKLASGGDRDMAAMANYQRALIAERGGKNADATRMLRDLSTAGSTMVPKPMALLELANVLRQSDPKEAAAVYNQIKRENPNTAVADEADRGLMSLAPKS